MAPESLKPSLPLIAVVGPTASGKTELALSLAHALGGEIVSADMGQLYRRLDAGTAKPQGTWRDGVYRVDGIPYHLVDILEPAENPDAGAYARRAEALLGEISARDRRPILAGGTGLYLRALLEGLDEVPPGDADVRHRLGERILAEGNATLHAELSARDPEAARRIPPGNTQRLLRALEVLEVSGRPISEFWSAGAKTRKAHEVTYIGIAWELGDLQDRIRTRAASMFPGMLREARSLVPSQFSGKEPGFRCLGYPQALACLRGEMSETEGLEKMTAATIAYAKRQRTWFRHQTDVSWKLASRTREFIEELA